MSSNEYQTPDLASILKTLASLTPQNQQQPRGQQASQDPQLPPYVAPPKEAAQQVWSPPQAPHQNPPSINAQKVVDPATIIDWSSGLKCVMRTVAKHESMLQDIRRMIKVQHEHEVQWWKGRQDFIEKQKARKENQKKLDEVLKLVGGAVATGSSDSSPEEMARELEAFDMKVYKAQMQMVREFTAKLRSLGVPFFGTKSELVRVAGKEGAVSGGPKDEKGMIDEVELLKLQKKMLAILEDLCSD